MNSMESAKKNLNPNPLSLEESLPNDVIITILAKISRTYYPFLSLVSKTFKSLIYSTDLLKIRSSQGTTETTLFISLKLPNQETLSWYNLWKNPNYRSNYILVPTNRLYNNPVHSSSTAVIDSIAYTIGGHDNFSCTLQRFCRKTSVSFPGPDMKIARKNAVVYPFRQKIYVLGGCNDSETTDFGEVFDIKTRTWESFICPDVLRGYKIYKVKSLESKIYVWTDTRDFLYDINEDKWEVLEERLSRSKTWCVVNGELYLHEYEYGLRWFNNQTRSWIQVKGLFGFITLCKSKRMVEIIEYDGKLLMFWDHIDREIQSNDDLNQKKIICCAEIELQNRGGVMWGKVEWIDSVDLKVPNSYDFVNGFSRPV